MDIKDMTMEQVEARAEEIREALTAEDADLEALNAEADQLAERRAAIIAEQRDAMKAVAAGAGKLIEEREDKQTMNEIRNSQAYIEAYANYLKTNDATECRSLLTDNVTGGSVPAPTFVADIVAERVKRSEILSRVRTMNAKGNVKVGFEFAAPAAGVHTEGGQAIEEEALVTGIVTLVPQTYKKWVSISDEALDTMAGEAYVRYIYDEVTRGIVKAIESSVIGAIEDGNTDSSVIAPMIGTLTISTPALTDIINLRALLSSAAEDLVVITTPALYAAYKALAITAQYAADPFDGLHVIINENAGGVIVGDLSGVMVNYPNGEEVEFKYDDKTLMTSDMVRILGRVPAAVGLVGNKFFAVGTQGN